MNNKKGSVGGRILLVLVLMLLAAGAGAYGYSVLDGKLAVRDAQKLVKDIDMADYDTEEASQLQVHLNNVGKDLETAKSRKEVYEIIDDFKEEVSKLQTKAEKELEAAKREAEEARRANQNNYNNNNNSQSQNGSDQNGSSQSYGNSTSSQDSTGNSGNSQGGYKSNNLTDAEDGTEEAGSLFNSLFGNKSDDNN